MSDKLVFKTLALRRELPSDHHEMSPVIAPAVVSYGNDDQVASQLALALSELPDESRPTTVARYLLPAGVRLEHFAFELGREGLPGRLARKHPVTLSVILVPEPRNFPAPRSESAALHPGAEPSGHWVFIPVLDHACFVARNEDLAKRLASELEVLPAALALSIDGWKRLLTWAKPSLEEVDVELSTTPLAQAHGRKALAEVERKRQAQAVLDGAGRRMQIAETAPLVGRELLLADLTRALDGRARRSMLLVGDEAVGKSALVEAWSAANPSRMIWTTSATELVAGASGLGEWQERVASVMAAAETLDAVLFFDDFGALFADRPAEGGVELPAAMRRHVVDGRVRVVGELTAVALDRAERRDVSLIGAMLRITVPPTDAAMTIAAGKAWAAHWAKTQPHRPQIAASSVPAAVDLARRYLPYRAFPGKAIRVLEELRVAHDMDRDDAGRGRVLGEAELYAAFSWTSGIPVALLADDQAISIDEVIRALRRRMIGQDPAVVRVAEAICVAKARLSPADKPLASLFFVGPTGTGKTELARSVASYLFGATDKMVRLDMSEYTDPWAAERLFGSGDDDGRLTSAVRSQPFGVVLLDEIEKAHPSVFDLLLQVLGEARLTDGRGRTTFFHNAIIVLTSNLGTRSARGKLGISPHEDDALREERRYRDAVLGAFRPELINRLDQIVVFHPLGETDIAKIAEIAVGRLSERRGLTQSGVTLDVSPNALGVLADRGFSAELGARALRRYIDANVLGPAARLLARSGAEGHGGTLTVRAPDEIVLKNAGGKLGDHEGDVTVALWRRSAATGRRMVRSALALGGLRRDTDRELMLPNALAVRERIAEVEATLATAAQKHNNKQALPGAEIARLGTEHARLTERHDACVSGQAELRTAEELCLEALARDVDAIDLIDGAILARYQFRRDLFWLLTALRPVAPGATLLVHSPDARSAVVAWTKYALDVAEHHNWKPTVHLWGTQNAMWGHGYDLAWAREHLAGKNPPALLLRVNGAGADLLFGLEQGLHRFHGLAGQPCHLWVDLVEQDTEFKTTPESDEWRLIPPPPTPLAARGSPMREAAIAGDNVVVEGEEVELAWSVLGARAEEAAVVRFLIAAAKENGLDRLWEWPNPVAAYRARLAAEKAAAQ